MTDSSEIGVCDLVVIFVKGFSILDVTLPWTSPITVAVARAKGVKLSYADPLAHVKEVCGFTVGNQCSMLLDVLNNRPTEIDLINGAVVREGKKVGVPTPVNEVIVNIVKVKERKYNKN